MLTAILILSIMNFALFIYVMFYYGREEEEVYGNPSYDESVTNSLTVQEHVALREEAHDDRIRRMKDELAKQIFPARAQRPINTDDALELDPNVKNLPHSIIDATHGRSLTEVSE